MLIQRNEIFNPASQFMIDNQAKSIHNVVYHDCRKNRKGYRRGD